MGITGRREPHLAVRMKPSIAMNRNCAKVTTVPLPGHSLNTTSVNITALTITTGTIFHLTEEQRH